MGMHVCCLEADGSGDTAEFSPFQRLYVSVTKSNVVLVVNTAKMFVECLGTWSGGMGDGGERNAAPEATTSSPALKIFSVERWP